MFTNNRKPVICSRKFRGLITHIWEIRMKVCVCFKVVEDLEKVVPTDWQEFEGFPDTSYVGKIIGYFDEVALELALRLKDNNEDISCTAVTLGEVPARLSKKIYAAGFDEVVCLDSSEVEFAPKQVAQKLSDYLREEKFDLVITGKQTSRMDSGTVPIYLASQMKLPIISNVLSCTLEETTLLVEHETDLGYHSSIVKMPLVLSVGNNDIPGLRLATFRAQMEAGKRVVTHKEETKVEPLDHKLLKKQIKICDFIDGDVNEQAKFIIDKIFKEVGP